MRYWLSGLALTLALVIALPLVALVLGATWDDIVVAAGDADVVAAIGTSLACAVVAIALALLLGVPAAYLMARQSIPGTRLLRAVTDLPVVVPHPVLGIGLLLVFAKNALVGAALREHFGLQVASAAPGIVIAMLVVSAPFVVKAAYEGFRAVPRTLERAACSLGASDARVFFTIALPLAWRTIRAGALLAWGRAVSEFGSIVVLAYYPRTAPVLIWDRFSAYGLRAAIAPAVLLLVVCLALYALLQSLDQGATTQELER